mgnify:FL=1
MNSKILVIKNTLYFFGSIMSIAIPVKIFIYLFLKQIRYLPFNNDDLIMTIGISVFYTLICLVLVSIFFKTTFGALIFLVIYPVLFTFLVYQTAYEYRVEFGNTWTSMEVLTGLVLTHGFYYVLLFTGIAAHFSLNLWYLITKK